MKLGSCFLFLLLTANAASYRNFPIAFEPDANAYIAHGDGYSLQLTAQGVDILLRNDRISMRLTGANRSVPEPLDILPGTVSYFRGNDPAKWRTGIPTYSRVRADNVYPGIDLVFHGNQTRLEYDFVVSPAADPSRIRLRFSGAFRRDPEGNLILSTHSGHFIQRRPIAYQDIGGERREIPSRFAVRRNGEISFVLGKYDRSAPLVIDPVLSYATFLGGNRADELHAITVDSAGNSYVAGITTSTNRGDADATLRKINPTGTAVLYTANFGGGGTDEANAVAVDPSGNIFVAGRTDSSDFPNPAGAFQRGNAGGIDAFLLRVNPNTNQLLFSTYFGGSGDDRALALALDPAGNAYITGSTSSTDLNTNAAAFSRRNAGGVDGFVAKFDSLGNASFATYIGGAADDFGYGIAADAAGRIYVAGSTNSDNFPLTAALQGSRRGNTDAFVMRMDASGATLLFSTYLGGGNRDVAQAIALDSSGNIYVAGSTASGDFPTVRGSYQTENAGGDSDIFVTKLSPDGRTAFYSTYIGSHGTDIANGIAVDSTGQAFITGSTDSDQFPVTDNAQQINRAGNSDVVLFELNQPGTAAIYSTFLGGATDETGRAIALDSAGNAYIAGITNSSGFPATGQSVQNVYGGGGSDGFIAKISFPTTPPTVNPGGVVNGGNFASGPVAPGSLITIFGSNLASSATGATATPLPTTLGGITVNINGTPAPIVYVGTNQINVQLPYEVRPGTATATIAGPGGTSATSSFAVAQAAPAIFVNNNRGVVQNQDFSLNTGSNPAKTGTVIVVYFTGQGPLDNSVSTGVRTPNSPLSRATLPASATIGGVNAPLQFIGLTPGYVGLAQANIVVPQLTTGDYPLVLNAGGVPSNSALVSVSSN